MCSCLRLRVCVGRSPTTCWRSVIVRACARVWVCRTKLRSHESVINTFRHDLNALAQDILDPERLATGLEEMHRRFVSEEITVATSDLVRVPLTRLAPPLLRAVAVWLFAALCGCATACDVCVCVAVSVRAQTRCGCDLCAGHLARVRASARLPAASHGGDEEADRHRDGGECSGEWAYHAGSQL
jgi:hypothetical protein